MRRPWHPETAEIELARVMHALSDPARLEIVARLEELGPESCGTVAQDLDLHKSTVSHHYRVLREAGITATEIQGRTRWTTLRSADLEERFPGLLPAVLAAHARTPERHV